MNCLKSVKYKGGPYKATKPVKITDTEEISCRCPNDNYEVG